MFVVHVVPFEDLSFFHISQVTSMFFNHVQWYCTALWGLCILYVHTRVEKAADNKRSMRWVAEHGPWQSYHHWALPRLAVQECVGQAGPSLCDTRHTARWIQALETPQIHKAIQNGYLSLWGNLQFGALPICLWGTPNLCTRVSIENWRDTGTPCCFVFEGS
jgi:hypothetical protein